MGGNSSKEPADGQPLESVNKDITSVYIQSESAAADRFKHQGPIHCLCAIDQNSILSGGADEV